MIRWRPKVGELARLNKWFTKIGSTQYYDAQGGDLGVVIDIIDAVLGSYRVYVNRTIRVDRLYYSYFDRISD